MATGTRLDEARLALMLLTRLPAGRLAGTAPALGRAAKAFPLVGLITGPIGWAVYAGASAAGLPTGVAAGLTLFALALATGALHLDGLADCADGLFGGRDRARRLEIMRDSRIGSYGVAALILCLGLQGTAIAAAAPALPAFLLAGVGSRIAMTAVLIALPPARDDGLGRSAARAGWGALAPGGAVLLVVAAMSGPIALPALALAALATFWVARLARARIGGQTGDVLGASQALAETAIWITLSATAP